MADVPRPQPALLRRYRCARRLHLLSRRALPRCAPSPSDRQRRGPPRRSRRRFPAAYRISVSGSDWTKIRLRDVDSGEDLVLPGSGALEEVPRVKFSGVSWTNNSRGFFYSRYPEEGHGGAGAPCCPVRREVPDTLPRSDATGRETGSLARQSVFYHRVGTPYAEDRLVFQTPDHPKWLHGAEVSEDGNYLLLTVRQLSTPSPFPSVTSAAVGVLNPSLGSPSTAATP